MTNKNGFMKGALCGALAMLFIIAAGGAGYRYFISDRGINFKQEKGKDAARVIDDATQTKLGLMRALMQTRYLREGEINEEALIDGIYKGFIEGLGDPYAAYFNEKETEALMQTTAGEFGGIGVSVSKDLESGFFSLTNVKGDTPGGKAGIQEADLLYKVEGESVEGLTVEQVVSRIRGEVGTNVNITVVRKETGEEKDLTIKREIIEDETVSYEMKAGQIGYIYVKEFDTITLEQFQEALDELEKQGMKGLIVDLRNNGGGNLDTVSEMLDLLLPEGTIVYTEDKNGKKQTFTSDEERKYENPCAVLVNGYSASASEIFAGAIQDYELGDIIGETTYGKGVVQQIFDLKDNTSVKITISEYFTPKGRNIDGTGITPDMEVKYTYDETNPEYDNQLEAALSNVKEKIDKK